VPSSSSTPPHARSGRPSRNGQSGSGGRPPRKPRRRQSGPQSGPQRAPEPNLFDQVGVTAVEPAPFDQLGLPPKLVRALADRGLAEAFPIQAATIPDALSGRDVLGRGQTGSGKTLAFGLPLLAGSEAPARPLHPRALVLVPTRELASQVTESLKPLAKTMGKYVREIVGGTSFTRQADTLRRGVDVIVATPGRLADHVRQGTCSLSEVERTALDEADQMADMGFLPQVRELLDLVPADGQRMLFSATLDGDVNKLVKQYLTDPAVHSLAPSAASVDSMEHHQLLVSTEDKQSVLNQIANREGRTILFVRTKHHADRLSRKLRGVGVPANALHGGKAQNARTRVLDDFRAGRTSALVATNVAARGIHVDDVSLVVHVEPPADPKDYLHRAGRTARAGAEGTVVTLVTDEEKRAFRVMTGKAGVELTTTRVTAGDVELARLTGAREPTGVALTEAPAQPAGRGRPPARGGRTGGARPQGGRDGGPRRGAEGGSRGGGQRGGQRGGQPRGSGSGRGGQRGDRRASA
jgi:superfamily II DNA/RNA helicase